MAFRVLTVDDNPDIADSLAMVLRLHGLEVDIAYSGDAALQLTDDREYDVILLDLAMPKTDGLQVVQKIKNNSRCSDPLVIAITGYGDERTQQLTHDVGFDGHLLKPVNPSDLIELIKMAASKRPIGAVDIFRADGHNVCEIETWKTDDVKVLVIQVHDQVLKPRKCRLRHGEGGDVVAIRFDVNVTEVFSLTAEEAPAWRFTLRENESFFGAEKGWRLVELDRVSDSKYSLCLHPA